MGRAGENAHIALRATDIITRLGHTTMVFKADQEQSLNEMDANLRGA